MDAHSIEQALRTAILPHLKIPGETLSYLAAVLSDLTLDELADFEAVRLLLEPFLLDARKPGRERPHDKKSESTVDKLCRGVFDQLQAVARGRRPSPPSALQPPRVAAATASAATTAIDADAPPAGSIAAARAAVVSGLGSLDSELHIADGMLDHLAVVLAELPDKDLEDVAQLSTLLEPLLLESFHALGKWAADEDVQQMHALCQAISRKLLRSRQGAGTAASVLRIGASAGGGGAS
mmetsp:Transcript_76938/g.207535  ORF Transcript_76938/g.207535 Transcript_76938/m.207535 type:complete len:238 (-) Transcript_76938:25-738(-)